MLDWAARRAFAQQALLAREGVRNGELLPVWIDDHRFWYERQGSEGAEYRLVDARTGAGEIAVTRRALAEALAGHFDAPVEASALIVADVRFDLAADVMTFTAFGLPFAWALSDRHLSRADKATDLNWLAAPDGRSAIFLRGANLWLRDRASGAEHALTTDGTHDYAYGDVPSAMRGARGRMADSAPHAIWSPDGAWILTVQTDERSVPDLPLVDYAPLDGVRPRLRSTRVSLPGDPQVTEFAMIAVHVATGRQVRARYSRLPAVRMNNTPIGAGLCWWAGDSRSAYFVDIERGEARAHVVAFDLDTGAARVVFTEESESYVEVGVNVYMPALIAPLPDTGELLWYSERSGHGHLYLYDLATGALRNRVTAGAWQVLEILHLDVARREVMFLAGGIARDEAPYVARPCIASLDGGEVTVVSDESGNHKLWKPGEFDLFSKKQEGIDPLTISAVSPKGSHFVETISSVNGLPRTYLRARDGRQVALLEQAEADMPAGWQEPEPVQCKAADGRTDLFGLLFKPLGFDATQRYPLIDLIYGGPQLATVPHAHFSVGILQGQRYLDAVHLSALGAYVLMLDGRGTSNRERDFRTASHGAAQDASHLEDHVAAICDLALARPQIDMDRIGITGFSAGGYMAAHAALRFGDVFKVAVAGGGNYDQAVFWHSWGERYHGPFEQEHYARQAAKTYAAGMTGRLMLVHGMLDEGCHPAGLFQLVEALIEAGKDPDLVLLPRGGHEWTGYGARRRWDYFARHLIGGEPDCSQPFEREIDRIGRRVKYNEVPPGERS